MEKIRETERKEREGERERERERERETDDADELGVIIIYLDTLSPLTK